jgi:hypothetical protein
MAKIKYIGPISPLRVPGVGFVGKQWTPCPEDIAREFSERKQALSPLVKKPECPENIKREYEELAAFEIELDPVLSPSPAASSTDKKNTGGKSE